MKTPLSFFIFSWIVAGCITFSYAQSSGSATASATIVTPISIQKVNEGNLDFGNIAAGESNGMVILGTDGGRRIEGGVSLPSTFGKISPAEFMITGEGSYSFSITLPSSPITLTNTNGANETMIVDSFISNPQTTGNLTNGKQMLKVGANLHVAANQAPGIYISDAPFTVTVNYN
jgi:hypothetical protein